MEIFGLGSGPRDVADLDVNPREVGDLCDRLLTLHTGLERRLELADPEPWILNYVNSCRVLLRDGNELMRKLELQESPYEKLSNKILPKRRNREQNSLRLDLRLLRMEVGILESLVNTNELRDSIVRAIPNHHCTLLTSNNPDRFSQLHSLSAASTSHTTSEVGVDVQNHANSTPTLEKLCQLCMTGLDIVFNALECPDFKELSFQMQAWAFGLLQGPHSLDIVLRDSEVAGMKPNHHPPWVERLMTAFYRILLDTEIIVRILHLTDADSAAFLREASFAVSKSTLSARAVDSPDMSAMNEQQAAAEHVASSAKSISQCIDHLFQLVPAIEVVRDFHCFHPEYLADMATVWELHRVETPMPLDELTDHVMHMIGEVVGEAEVRARMEKEEGKEKSLMDRLVVLLKDEAAKLENWRPQKGSSIDPAEQQQARTALSVMEKSLTKWAEDYKKMTRERNPASQDFTPIIGKVQQGLEELTFDSSLVKGKGKGAEMLSPTGEKRRKSMEKKATGTGGDVSGTQAALAAPCYSA